MVPTSHSPPRAPRVKYTAPLGTRWEKEKRAAGEGAFDLADDAKYVGPWIIGECVGKGASGRVKIAKHRVTGQLAAVKILPLQPLISSRASLATQQAKSEKQRLGIDREIIMMKLMNHPNIMRIYDVYEGERDLYLILEYVEGGELFDFLVNRGRLHSLEALAYFKQIIYGLNYAHTFSIIHRDLKPENILIHSLNPPLIKIADWGMAALAPPELKLETSCGSPHYASPEIVNGDQYEGNATDIWSCGVILYALLTGRLPFDDENIKKLLLKVKAGKYDMPTWINPQAMDLLARMLVVDVNKRITIPQILAHPWLINATPGILYVPAPSVNDLATPLRSAAHIDRDLFESLLVIWGRNADRSDIKADLLSPAGSGMLAKAFYFLLHLYREQTLKDSGIMNDASDTGVDGKTVTKQYTAPPIRGGGRVRGEATLRIRTDRDAPAPPSRSPSPQPPRLVTSKLVAEQPLPRPRPTSPVGPRLPKMRPVSSPMPTYAQFRNGGPDPSAVVTDRPTVARRSSAVPSGPPQLPPLHIRNQAVFQSMNCGSPPVVVTPHFPVISPRSSAVPTISAQTVHAPIPRPATMNQPLMPLLRAPRITNVEFQKTIDDITDRVNILVAHENAAQALGSRASPEGFVNVHGQGPSQSNARDSHRQPQTQGFHAYSPANFTLPEGFEESENKENKVDNKRVSYSGADPMQVSGGLFGKRAGGELIKESKGKDKRSRPPPLEFHPQRTKQSNAGSPNPPGSPIFMMSPVVGEFKGWFSNLFNWKAQSFFLCSTSGVVHTRNETTRLLQQFGVVVALEDTDGRGQLKCRIDDILDASTGSVVQKATRFRVELHSASGSAFVSNIGIGPSRLSQQNPSSPNANQTRHSNMNKYMVAGSQCMVVVIQEKGAVSTFRAICQQLKDEWILDALQSPIIGPDGTTPLMEHAQRLME